MCVYVICDVQQIEIPATIDVERIPIIEKAGEPATCYVQHVPPLELSVTLPHSYPSEQPPKFALSSCWHSSFALTAICNKLDQLWHECGNSIVLMEWISYLQSNALQMAFDDPSTSALSHSTGLQGLLITQYTMISDDLRDSRAIPSVNDAASTLLAILRYDHEQLERKYWHSMHECGVCWSKVWLALTQQCTVLHYHIAGQPSNRVPNSHDARIASMWLSRNGVMTASECLVVCMSHASIACESICKSISKAARRTNFGMSIE
jgi:hypothetical protein